MPMSGRLLRPRATGFDPRSIAGLVGWFDASRIAAGDLDGNGNVQTWRNLGSGGNATNGIANNRPTPTANGLNGRQVLTFDGSNDRLTWNADTLSDATILAVSRQIVPASGTATEQPIVGAGANAGQAGGLANVVKNDNASSSLDFAVGGFSVGTNRILYNWLPGGYGAGNGRSYGPTVLSALWSSAGMLLRENGIKRGAAPTPGGFQPAHFGANNSSLLVMNGYIAEVLIYTPRLSATQVGVVERYLGRKWGITVYSPPTYADSDVNAYITAVELADGQALETGVRDAINTFITGCKSDGIWPAIKASCLLMGARTLSGALTPLVGTAPTNNNFVSGDYNRVTGLKGDGTTKSISTGYQRGSDFLDNIHFGCFASGYSFGQSRFLIGSGGADRIFHTGTTSYTTRNRSNTDDGPSGTPSSGYIGISRSESSGYTFRRSGSDTAVTRDSNSVAVGINGTFIVFDAGGGRFSGSISFYSIGESLNLALLDTRVSALITAIGAAIP